MFWDIPVPKYQGIKGKILDDWQISGITQFQSGFPIRLQTQNDNELIGSLFFLGTGAPQMTGNVPHSMLRSQGTPASSDLSRSRPVQRSHPGPVRYHAAINLLRPRRTTSGTSRSRRKFRSPRPVTSSSVRTFSICSTIRSSYNPDGNIASSHVRASPVRRRPASSTSLL